MRRSIEQFKQLRESEDNVEFKKGEQGNVSYNGGNKTEARDRRKCILGYVTALCNMKGGDLVIGMHDKHPHDVIGTKQAENAIGKLEGEIYKDTGIKTDIYELFEDGKRVLVINVPPRPAGRVFKFEDVPLMRVGEDLRPMSDEVYLSIIQEQEPDFSEQYCDGVTFDDLDPAAIKILKEKYALKQHNPAFISLSDEQALSDLHLIYMGKVTNAALILVGKEEVLKQKYPQVQISLEYRSNESNIHFDHREYFTAPYYLMVDDLWEKINARNGYIPVRNGMYKSYEIPLFNEDVIREAINNAVAHRDYKITSETVIRQYPTKMIVTNSGGLPHGVTIENILYALSTPRNRLLADVLSKTGLVERSGQGVDQIYLNTISEGKPIPDYSKTDAFCVTLILSSKIEDMAFSQYVMGIQESLPENNKLSVYEVMTLNSIRLSKDRSSLDKSIVSKLLKEGFIEQRGKTSGTYYILGKDYYEMAGKMGEYSKISDWSEDQALSMMTSFLSKHGKAKMGEFVELFSGHLSRKQIRTIVDKLVDLEMLSYKGEKNMRYYFLGKKYKESVELIDKALTIGLNEIKKLEKGQ